MVNPDRNLYEPPYDDALLYESDLEPERPRSRPLVVLLGIVVLAAFAGVVWVAYNQGVKHGQTGAPILAADAGPTRVPGEANGDIKDVAADKSYDRLFGANAEPQSENVLPAPEQPRTVASTEGSQVQSTDPTQAQGGPNVKNLSDVPPLTDEAASGSPQAIVSAQPKPMPAPPSEDITSSLPPAVTATTPAPKQITPPAPAPKKLAQVEPAPAPVEPKAEDAAVTELTTPTPAPPPAAAPKGVMIQLGSFPNDGLAAQAWGKIKSANQDLLGAYSPTIKPAEIEGKGTWFRLRVGGFPDKESASAVCDQLTAKGQACIIAGK